MAEKRYGAFGLLAVSSCPARTATECVFTGLSGCIKIGFFSSIAIFIVPIGDACDAAEIPLRFSHDIEVCFFRLFVPLIIGVFHAGIAETVFAGLAIRSIIRFFHHIAPVIVCPLYKGVMIFIGEELCVQVVMGFLHLIAACVVLPCDAGAVLFRKKVRVFATWFSIHTVVRFLYPVTPLIVHPFDEGVVIIVDTRVPILVVESLFRLVALLVIRPFHAGVLAKLMAARSAIFSVVRFFHLVALGIVRELH